MSGENADNDAMLNEGVAGQTSPAINVANAGKRIPAFVINLDSDHELWQDLLKDATTHGIELHRVPAIDGRVLDRSEWTGVDIEAFQRFTGREILAGEYGCYRSHLKALQQFLADGRPFGVILEDDAAIDERTAGRVQAIVDTVKTFDLVKLANHRTRYLIRAVTTKAGDYVGRTIQGRQGSAAAYLVSRQGAQRLLTALETMAFPYDVALERFWDHGTRTLTTKENVFGYTERPEGSSISPNGYAETKFSRHQRMPKVAFTLSDHFTRTRQVFNRDDWMRLPDGPSSTADHLTVTEGSLAVRTMPNQLLVFLAALSVLAFTSVLWIERDAYRFAGIGLIVVALIYYFRRDLMTYGKPLIGWMGWLCIVWALVVLARIANAYLDSGGQAVGTAEGIYLFPLLYPTLGYALYVFIREPSKLVSVFMVISLVVLIGASDFHSIFRGLRATTWLHNNPIHASLASGFILLSSIPFLLYTLRRDGLSNWWRSTYIILGCLVFLISLANVVALQSKGVWAGLAVALPVMFLAIALTEKNRVTQLVALAALAVAAGCAFAAYSLIWNVSSDTIIAVKSILADIKAGKGVFASGALAIANESLPEGFRIRLELMANAVRLWEQNPLLGAGPNWLSLWAERPYKLSNFNLLHNGYLEVMVRYGALGLAFYAALYVWAIGKALRAAKAGLIDWTAFQFFVAGFALFGIALATNSHIRLATGESLMWLAAAFGFYCYYLLQQRELTKSRTWF